MSDAFISYSRKDRDFVLRLHEGLAAQQRDIWVDFEDIPATADWWREIQGGIEGANAFIFIISPDSVHSEVCNRELDYALQNNKRLIPLLRREVTDKADQQAVHPAIGSHNWIFFRDSDDFDRSFAQLVKALDTDLGYVRVHTRVLMRAKEWDLNNRNSSFLLQGDDLNNAETWLAQAVAKTPAPTDLHTAYILASRRAASLRQRRLLAGVSVALVVSLALAVLSLGLYGEANRQQIIAVNNALTATIAQGAAEFNAATATVAQGQAQDNAATAVAGATAVADANQLAQSVALAGQAELELNGPRPERSVLLALAAFQNNRYTWQAERALASSIQPTLEHTALDGSGKITSLDWSPDGTQLVTSTNEGKQLVWQSDGQAAFMLEDQQAVSLGSVTVIHWSPDGELIAAGSSDGQVQIWSVSSPSSPQFTLVDPSGTAAHTDSVLDMAWSPDGAHLATASADRTVKIWQAADGTLQATLTGHTAGVNGVQWSPDGTRLVTVGSDRMAKIWDSASGKEVSTPIGQTLLAAWSPDGKLLATASQSNAVLIWTVNDAEAVLQYTLNGHTGRINRIAWSADSLHLASASSDDTARIWDAVNGQLLRTLFGHTDNVNDVAWASSVGNPRLITVSDDQTARIWNSDTGGQLLVFSGPSGALTRVSWAADGEHFATLADDGTARLWQVWKSGKALINLAKSCCASRILTDEENIRFGLPTATVPAPPDPMPTLSADCADAMPPRLYPKARGKVTEDNATPLNVRPKPGTAFPRIAQVSPGQTFEVLEGPTCAEGLNWFHIIYGVGAVQGWIAEGQDGQYFVQPVQ
jgi:WD40 repeat protein